MSDFTNKVVVVTGAAKGIGKSVVQKFSSKGAKTVILDFDEEEGTSLSENLSSKYNESLFIKTDISKKNEMVIAREKVVDQFGKVDILIINAGISYKHNIKEISFDEWDKVINVNLNGSFYTIKSFIDDFNEEGSKIIFITSGSAITGTGGGAHYASSKSGQHGLMRALSKELGPKGINVNAIAPRVIQTEILDELYPTEESRKNLVKQIPIGRIGLTEDIANIACFLASEESSYIHGQIILADGGRTL